MGLKDRLELLEFEEIEHGALECQEEKPKSFLAEVVESLLGNHVRSLAEKEALAYLVWVTEGFRLEDKLEAMAMISDSINPYSTSLGCVFSERLTLRGFLRRYCETAEYLSGEIPDSIHGIDFKWSIYALSSPGRNGTGIEAAAVHDKDIYGEFELCKEAALNKLEELPAPKGTIAITAEYWNAPGIAIRLEVNGKGEISGISSEDPDADACARIVAIKKTGDEENRAYWRELKPLKAEAKARGEGNAKRESKILVELMSEMAHKRINPFLDIDGSYALEIQREQLFRKYEGVVDAFFKVNPKDLKCNYNALKTMFDNSI